MKASEFPIEIQELIFQRQKEADNKRDITVFDSNIYSSTDQGGFNWHNTIEGGFFWTEVLTEENFDLFYEKYPKKSQFMSKIVFEPDVAYWAETTEEDKMFTEEVQRQGYKYCSGYLFTSVWKVHKENTVYYPLEGKNSSIRYAKEKNYKIVKIKDLFKQQINNNQNNEEKTRISHSIEGPSRGTSCSISRTAGQIATASRLVGNTTEFSIKKPRVTTGKIKSNSISF